MILTTCEGNTGLNSMGCIGDLGSAPICRILFQKIKDFTGAENKFTYADVELYSNWLAKMNLVSENDDGSRIIPTKIATEPAFEKANEIVYSATKKDSSYPVFCAVKQKKLPTTLRGNRSKF